MFQNYNYYPQQNQQVTQQQPMYQMPTYRQAPPQVGLKGRLVSSLEEARASSIDFDGSIFYFPDIANKRIYTKQINMDGTATLCLYELKEFPNENTISNNCTIPLDKFVTREEFERVLAEIRQKQDPSLTMPAAAQTKEVLPF